ncbi:MAG: hypothetical protein PVH39_09700, partial [Syntrophobacterales bacterium]
MKNEFWWDRPLCLSISVHENQSVGRASVPANGAVIQMHHRNIPPRDIPRAQANVSVDYSG